MDYQILCIFATAKQERPVIGLWCNGNTTDSGPVIPGSNPGSPTNLPYLSQKTTKIASFSGFFVAFRPCTKISV